MGKGKKAVSVLLVGCMTAAMLLAGCGDSNSSGKTEIEIIQYKPEATDYFDALEEEFNATHDDIHLTIDSPNDASTIMKTRFIREDYPDIIGIGGDINYSYYVDAEILADGGRGERADRAFSRKVHGVAPRSKDVRRARPIGRRRFNHLEVWRRRRSTMFDGAGARFVKKRENFCRKAEDAEGPKASENLFFLGNESV